MTYLCFLHARRNILPARLLALIILHGLRFLLRLLSTERLLRLTGEPLATDGATLGGRRLVLVLERVPRRRDLVRSGLGRWGEEVGGLRIGSFSISLRNESKF